MKIISEALNQKNLKVEQLSQELQSKIASLKDMIEKYNAACDAYDEEDEIDTDTEKILEQNEAYILNEEKVLAEEIKGTKLAADGTAANGGTVGNDGKGGGIGLGTLFIAGIIGIATFGAVNYLKKRG